MPDDPLSLTFGVLAASRRPGADEVLATAAAAPLAAVRDAAAGAICRRGSGRGLIELIRRFDELDDEARRQLSEPNEPVLKALRHAMKNGDESLIRRALGVARYGRHVELLPDVVPMLRDSSPAIAAETAETVAVLADDLADLLHRPAAAVGRLKRAELQPLREATLTALAAAVEPFDALAEPASVIEPLLLLGHPRDAAVGRVMRHTSVACRAFAADALACGRHPGVIRLLLEYLAEPYPPRRIFEAVATREDPEFISALLLGFPAEPSATLAANLRQIESVVWLDDPARLAELPDPLQGRVPPFLFALGLPEPRKREVQEWLVRFAGAEGRTAAAEALDRLDFDTIRRLLLDSLDSEDDGVAAWAAGQLRPRHVPGAFKLLADRLDSPSPAVREAARGQLRGFTVEHVVGIHDRLSEAMCLQASVLLRKIDPDCLRKLSALIASPIRRQRIAAAQAVGRLGMVEDLRHALVGLLADGDALLRRVGVEVLSADRSPAVADALRELLGDPSPRVRQAAASALGLTLQPVGSSDSGILR